MNPVVGGTAARIYKLENERPINSYNTRGDFVGEYKGCQQTGPKGQQFRETMNVKADNLTKNLTDMKGRTLNSQTRMTMTFSQRLNKMKVEQETEDLSNTHLELNGRFHQYEREREMRYQKNTIMLQRPPLSKEKAYTQALKKHARSFIHN